MLLIPLLLAATLTLSGCVTGKAVGATDLMQGVKEEAAGNNTALNSSDADAIAGFAVRLGQQSLTGGKQRADLSPLRPERAGHDCQRAREAQPVNKWSRFSA